MKKRPWTMTFFAIMHGAIAFGIPLQIMWIYDHHLVNDFSMIWHKIGVLNMLVILSSLVNAALFWRASQYILYTMPMSFLLMALNNYFVSSLGEDFTISQTAFATLLFIFPHFLLLHHKSSQVFWSQDLRWWLCPKRYPFGLPIMLQTSKGERIETHTFDISETGAFIKVNLEELIKGEEITLEIPGASGPYVFKAEIVRKAAPKGHYPAGIGVRFSKLDLSHYLYLKKMFSKDYSPS